MSVLIKQEIKFLNMQTVVVRKQISNFSLTRIQLQKSEPNVLPINHIFVVDVSGSMSSELSNIRRHLKNKLSSVMKDGHTISVVWFSGKNEAGVLKEEVEIKSLKDLKDFNDAVDRWLKPVGLTSFDSPLKIAKEIIERISVNRPNSLFSMVFLSDGYHNQGSWSDVRDNLKSLVPILQSSTFVEYGYYADTKAMQEMAEICGGDKIFSSNFESFEPEFDAKLSNSNLSSSKTLINIGTQPKFGIAWTMIDDQILIYSVQNSEVLLPSNVDFIDFIEIVNDFEAPIEIGKITNEQLLLASYVLSDKFRTDEVDDLLMELRCEELLKSYTNSYGKQKLNEFRDRLKSILFGNEVLPFVTKEKIQIKADQFSVLSLLNYLSDSETILFYPGHKDFVYNRIGAKRSDVNTKVTESDISKLKDVKNLSDMKATMDEIADSKAEFVYDKTVGHNVKDFVYNEDRANISVRVRYDGVVKLPKNDFGLIQLPSFIYRNYTILKDGLLNVQKLPISCTANDLKFLTSNGVEYKSDTEKDTDFETGTFFIILDLESLPIVNRKQVNSISATKLGQLSYELLKMQAMNKVLGYYDKVVFDNKKISESFIKEYGADAEVWLESIGVTQFNGYSPETIKEETKDTYTALSLEVKIAKCSSLPKVEDVMKSIEDGKSLKITESLMKPTIDSFKKESTSEVLSKFDEKTKSQILGDWINLYRKDVNIMKKELMNEISVMKFSQILSRKWFPEFSEIENSKLSMRIDGLDLDMNFVLSEKQIKL